MAKKTMRLCDCAPGTVVRFDFGGSATTPPRLFIAGRREGSLTLVEVLGKARKIALPGLAMDAWLWRGTLFVGCRRIKALGAFRALAEALGYEVTG